MFVDIMGCEVVLVDYVGEKNVVFVFIEGFDGMLCLFCKV